MGHYIVIGIVVVLIIGIQILFFVKTLKDINKFSDIFPKSANRLYAKDSEIFIKEDTEIIEKLEQESVLNEDVFVETEGYDKADDIELDESTVIESVVADLKSYLRKNKKEKIADDSVFRRIVNSINVYLRKNKGAAGDYHLMKDIVERNCDAKENEIDTQIPTPLYTGLMGTVLGIIVGVTFLISSGGLSALLDSDYDLVKGTTEPSEIIGRISGQDVVYKNKIVLVR